MSHISFKEGGSPNASPQKQERFQIQPAPESAIIASQRMVISGEIAENENIDKVNDGNNVDEQRKVSYSKEDANFNKKIAFVTKDKEYYESGYRQSPINSKSISDVIKTRIPAPAKKDLNKLKDSLFMVKSVKINQSGKLNTQSEKAIMTLNRSSHQSSAFNTKKKESVFKKTKAVASDYDIKVPDISDRKSIKMSERDAENSSKKRNSNASKRNKAMSKTFNKQQKESVPLQDDKSNEIKNCLLNNSDSTVGADNKCMKSNSSGSKSKPKTNRDILEKLDSVKQAVVSQQRNATMASNTDSINDNNRRTPVHFNHLQGQTMTANLIKSYDYMKQYDKEIAKDKEVEYKRNQKHQKSLRLEKEKEVSSKIKSLKNKLRFLNKLSPAVNDNEHRAEMKQKLKYKLVQEFSEEQLLTLKASSRKQSSQRGSVKNASSSNGLNLPSYQDDSQQKKIIDEHQHETTDKIIEPKFKKTANYLSEIKEIANSKPRFQENCKIKERLNKKILTDFSEFDVSVLQNNSEFYTPTRRQKFFFAQSPTTVNFHSYNNQTTRNETMEAYIDTKDYSRNNNNPGLETPSFQHKVKSTHDSLNKEKSVNDDKIQLKNSKTTRSGVTGKGFQFLLKKIENFHDRKQLMISFKAGMKQALKVNERSHLKLDISHSRNSGLYLEEREIKGGTVIENNGYSGATTGRYRSNKRDYRSGHYDAGRSYETSVDKGKYTDMKKNYQQNGRFIRNKGFFSRSNDTTENSGQR